MPIPAPPSIPLLGHIGTIDAVLPVASFYLLAKQYGEIYQLNMLGAQRLLDLTRVLTAGSQARSSSS